METIDIKKVSDVSFNAIVDLRFKKMPDFFLKQPLWVLKRHQCFVSRLSVAIIATE